MSHLTPWVCAALLTLSIVRQSPAQSPSAGESQKVQVISLAMHVGSTGTEAKRVVYAPPPGWYVRGHSVDCPKKTGHSSFTVNTVPQDWSYVSEEKIQSAYKALIDLAGEAPNGQTAGLKAKLVMERERLLSEVRKVRSTHHALVVEAAAKGEGLLWGGGELQLTVTAELVYVGTDKELESHVARQRAALRE